ncbi:MAG: NFACT family protein [Eubacteriaceae bacterium]|nr:NFACT family protein [Eubacteriaceae bacterium]
MPFDGLMLSLLASQLRDELINQRIQRIYQPSKDDIIFYFSDSRIRPLYISASGNCPRAHLTDVRYDNPASPPVFCMVLRKYLVGGIIRGIAQKDFDRVLVMDIESLDEAGNLRNLCLISEMMGKHSNITLVDSSMKILDSIKHVSGLRNTYRKIMPGFDYIFPPNEKTDPTSGRHREAVDMLSFMADLSPEKAIVSVFSGISTQAAQSFLLEEDLGGERLSSLGADKISDLPVRLSSFIERRLGEKKVCTYTDPEGRARDFSCGRYMSLESMDHTESSDPSAAVDSFYREKSLLSNVRTQYEEHIKRLSQVCEREKKKLALRQEELRGASDSEIYNVMGNLLLSNMHLLKKGMKTVEVDNFYDPEGGRITIPLREELTPSQNAQYYFKRYNRAKSAVNHLRELIAESERDSAYLEEQLYFLRCAENYSEADEILSELDRSGFLKAPRKKNGIKRPVKTDYLRYTSSDGYRILAGKNTVQNGELTFREAGKNDIWLHVKDVPGSHVILFTERGEYSDTALEEAAMIAVIHSDLKDSARVAVDYTRAGNVKKIPSRNYASVTFTDNRTLVITPDFKRIEGLREN